ncbi:MAG: T9SS type A sorting domain-containing protein [Saprospiraceae bacterium]|nr:T9SS type A sorting domain-containing protein [Saprospiraceae bacterium]
MLYLLSKKVPALFFVIIISTSISFSQICLTGGITLKRQTQIDSFPINYPGCTTIDGDLIIQEESNNLITSLASLSQLQSINGSLRIRSNDAIILFNGLHNITMVGVDLEISNNGNILSISGLNNINQVGGNVEIISNINLFSSGGLEGITDIPGALRIINNGISNPGFMPMLTSVGGLLSISSNDITSLNGLSNLQSVGGIFSIHNNDNLLSIDGLNSLSSVGATLEITSNNLLMSVGSLSSLTGVGGDLRIAFNPILTDINTFSGLSSIGFDLEINGNDQLPDLNGLHNIEYVGRDLYIFNNASLSTLTHLSNITHVDRWITVQSCSALNNLEGLENIDPIPIDWLYISNNINLTDCTYQNICNYLDDAGNGASISNNTTGCNTRSEIESTCSIVPIEWLEFKALRKENYVEVMWSTSMELNNEGFEVERSVNRRNWDKIGFIQGLGSSDKLQQYSFIDHRPYMGVSYYRLKQMDINGNYEYSDIIKISSQSVHEFNVYPNPATDFLHVGKHDDQKVKILDWKGKVVFKQISATQKLFIGDLEPGIYILQVVTDNNPIVSKFIKL